MTNEQHGQGLVLLLTPIEPHVHDHTANLRKAGFRVLTHTHEDASVPAVIGPEPRIMIAELGRGRRDATFNFVRRLKAHPLARHIPLIVYGHEMTANDIEATAYSGAMRLQIEPQDRVRLLGAMRGVQVAS